MPHTTSGITKEMVTSSGNHIWRISSAGNWLQKHTFSRYRMSSLGVKHVDLNDIICFLEPIININYIPSLNLNLRARKQRKMAACIKPFHSKWDNAISLIEFLEFHKILGVSHFIFYGNKHNFGASAYSVIINAFIDLSLFTVYLRCYRNMQVWER